MREMQGMGVEADVLSYQAVVEVCKRSGREEECRQLMEEMRERGLV